MPISLPQTRSAFLLSLWVIAPWFIAILYKQPMLGTLISFGAYLLVVSFPKLPTKKPIYVLLQGACILSALAVIGVNVTLGSLFILYLLWTWRFFSRLCRIAVNLSTFTNRPWRFSLFPINWSGPRSG